jgi:hypothetical protein
MNLNSSEGEQTPFLEEERQDQVPDAATTTKDSPATIFFKASDLELDLDSRDSKSSRKYFSTSAWKYYYMWVANGIFFLNVCIFATFLALTAYRSCPYVPGLVWCKPCPMSSFRKVVTAQHCCFSTGARCCRVGDARNRRYTWVYALYRLS